MANISNTDWNFLTHFFKAGMGALSVQFGDDVGNSITNT
jgi:hypothetical protein